MRRSARVAAGLVVTLAVALVTLEGALQAVAAVVWLTHRPRAVAAAAGRPTVLCVGDSYTYGIGASSTTSAYPARLEQLLRRRGDLDWRVVNGGWPGSSSRSVLLALPRQLAETHPRLVYVLVGANDRWARPQRVTRAELSRSDPQAYPWRWRTGRLLALLRQALVDARKRMAPAAGAVGATAGPPRQNASAVAPASQTLEGEAWRAVGAGDLVAAERDFRAAIAAAREPWPTAHVGLVEIGARLGRGDQVRQEVAWLERNYSLARDRGSAEALLAGLEKSGDDSELLRTAERVVAAIPEASGAWTAIAWQRFQRGDTAAAAAAIARSLAVPRTQPVERALALQRQAWIVRTRNPRLALASLVRAYLLSGYADGFTAGVSVDPRAFRRPLLIAVLDSLALQPAQRADVERLYARAVEDRDTERLLDVLDAHLRAIVKLVRASGAQPVILSYPFLNVSAEQAQRRAATAARAGFLAIRPTFDSLLLRRPRADYFVPDGHLNDAGYAIVAGLAAADAALRLPRRHD